MLSTVGSNGALLETWAATRDVEFILELRPARRSISARACVVAPVAGLQCLQLSRPPRGHAYLVSPSTPSPPAWRLLWTCKRQIGGRCPLPDSRPSPSQGRSGPDPSSATHAHIARPHHIEPRARMQAYTHRSARARARKTTTATHTHTQTSMYARACSCPGWDAGVPRTACRGRPLGSRRRLGRHVSSGVKATHIK